MLALAAAMLAIGLLLLILGLRGRRINDHPLCRRCGFDLIGLPTNPGPKRAGHAHSTEPAPSQPRCPECGADLSLRQRIRTGARRRRPLAVAFGLMLALAGLGVSSAVGWGLAAKYDWNKSKPAWLLLQQADGAHPDPMMLRELWRRLRAQRLSAAQARRIVDRALAVQADASIPWVDTWGLMIESGRDQSLINDQQWTAYAANARGTLAPGSGSPFSRHGGRLYFQPEMDVGQGRGGLSLTLRKRHELTRLVVNQQEVTIPADWNAHDTGQGFQLGLNGGFAQSPLPIPECGGEVSVESFWTVSIADSAGGDPERPLAQWVEHFSGRWDAQGARVFPHPLPDEAARSPASFPIQFQSIQGRPAPARGPKPR